MKQNPEHDQLLSNTSQDLFQAENIKHLEEQIKLTGKNDRIVLPDESLDVQAIYLQSFPYMPWLNDSYAGAELHPWTKAMATNPNVGIIGGKGRFARLGANPTATIVVSRHDRPEEHVLAFKDKAGNHCLPTLPMNEDKDAFNTVRRHLMNSVGQNLQNYAHQVSDLYSGNIADTETTIHTWETTQAFHLEMGKMATTGASTKPFRAFGDYEKQVWMPASEFAEHTDVRGTHKFLAQLALK